MKKASRRDYFFLSTASKPVLILINNEYVARNFDDDYACNVSSEHETELFSQLKNPDSVLRKRIERNLPDAFYVEDTFDIQLDKTAFPERLNNQKLALERFVVELKKQYPDIPVIAIRVSGAFKEKSNSSIQHIDLSQSLTKSFKVDGAIYLSDLNQNFADMMDETLAKAKANKSFSNAFRS